MKDHKTMLQGQTLGIVGAGNMGRALASGIVQSGLLPRQAVMASDVDAQQRKTMEDAAGIVTVDNNEKLAQFASILLLAVKPQIMNTVLTELAKSVRKDALIISIAAGIPLSRIEKYFPEHAVIRVMPNTPALVGKGISAVCPGKKALPQHADLASALLSSVGGVLRLPEEAMDAVTATSGSGPAYVFYFIEALVQGAKAQGLSQEAATRLVVDTVAGSVELLKKSCETPETLRQRVTSPGGTTEAALRHLDAHKAKEIWAGAIAAATKRGKELSQL